MILRTFKRPYDEMCFGDSVELALDDKETEMERMGLQSAPSCSGATDELPADNSKGAPSNGEQETGTLDMIPKSSRKRGPRSWARKKRRMDTIEARRIQRFLSEFDEDLTEKGSLERAEDILYKAAEQRYSSQPETDTRDGYWLHLGEGPAVELAALVATGLATEVDPQSGATLSTDLMVSAAAGAGFDVTVATTEDVSGCIETDSVSTSEATSGTRFKKVRKAEALGTATAESLAAPEKKMRAEGVLLVESEADPSSETAATPRPSNWETTESMETAAAESLAVPEEKMRAEGALLVESEADLSSETAATPRPSNWGTMTKSQKAHWRRWTKRWNK